jgi:hypothetical protein
MIPMFGLLIGYAPQPMAPSQDYGGGQAAQYMPPAAYQPQIQAPYYPAPRKTIPKRPIIATVLAIVGVVVLLISLATPWYDLKFDMSVDSGFGISSSVNVDAKYDFGGAKATVSANMMGMSMSQTCSTSWESDQMKNNTATKGVFKTTQLLDVLATVTTVLLLAGSAITIIRPGRKQVAVIFGLVAVIMCLVGPTYFAAQLPASQKSDQGDALSAASIIPGLGNFTSGDGPWKSFSGSTSTSINSSGTDVPIKMSWGPDSGWYLGWMGFAFSVAALAIVFTTKKSSAQQFQYGSQPQYFGQQSQYTPPPNTQYPQPPVQQYPAPPPSAPAGYPPAQQPPAFEYVPSSAPPPTPSAFNQPQPPPPAPFQPGRPPEPPYSP